MHEFYSEDREEFDLSELSLEQLYALSRLVSQLAAGEGAQRLIEGKPASRLSPAEMSALSQLEAREIRIEEMRQLGRSEAYIAIAAEIDAMIDKKLEDEGLSGLS